MRALILTAAILIAGSTSSDQATAADRSPHQPRIGHDSGHGAEITLAAHRGYSPHNGYSRHGYSRYGYSHQGYSPYHHRAPSYHHGHGCDRPVIVAPPIAVPYHYSPYGYYRGYSYYQGGMSVNTGRVGFSIAF